MKFINTLLPDLSGQPTFDLSDLFAIAENNTQYAEDLLLLFLENAEYGLRQLQQAYEQQRWDRVSALAHKLIPGCKQLHIHQLAGILHLIEQACQRKNYLIIKVLSDEALSTYFQVKDMLETELRKLKNVTSNT